MLVAPGRRKGVAAGAGVPFDITTRQGMQSRFRGNRSHGGEEVAKPQPSIATVPSPPRVTVMLWNSFTDSEETYFCCEMAHWELFRVMGTFTIPREVAQWELPGLQRDPRCKAPQISKHTRGRTTEIRRASASRKSSGFNEQKYKHRRAGRAEGGN